MQPSDQRIPLPPLLAEAHNRAFDDFYRRLRAEGFAEVRPGHGCVFRFIGREGSRLTELAERADLSKQAVGEVVDDLQTLGYVERAADPGDGRAKIIRLTPRGEQALSAAQRLFADVEREWAERFGAERVAALRELLEEVVLGGAEELAA